MTMFIAAFLPMALACAVITWAARRRETQLRMINRFQQLCLQAANETNTELVGDLNAANHLQLLEDWHEWGCETFQQATARSCLIHLQREVAEALEALDAEEANDIADRPAIESEAVDVVVLAYQAARRMTGANLGSLIAAIERKFKVVKQRTWAPPDADGVQEHVRDQNAGETGEVQP